MEAETLKLFVKESGGKSLTIRPQFEEDRFMDLQMNQVADPQESREPEKHLLSINADDAVLLRDYLTSVINLYDKKHTSENL